MNIQDFRSQIDSAGGFARLNRYQVLIYTTALQQASTAIGNSNFSLLQFDTDATDWMQYSVGEDTDLDSEALRLTAFCQSTALPGYQFQVETQRIYGPAFKIPHMPEWAEITMSFICGADMVEKYFFEAWQYMVMDPMTNNFNYVSEYGCDIDLSTFDEADNVNYVTTLIDAWPVSVNNIALAAESNNAVQRIDVTFTYKFASWFKGSSRTVGPRGKRELFNDTVGVTPTQAGKG